MLSAKFGIEIEFTGITREKAARGAAEFLQGNYSEGGTYYDTKKVKALDGRVWKFMYDGSIKCQRKEGRRKVAAGKDYSVEMVSPILTYREDIETLQELVRKLRKAGAFTNSSCGIHIHLDGSNHTPRSIRNFVNIIASKNDLFYKALQIAPERMRYCKKMDSICLLYTSNSGKLWNPMSVKVWYESTLTCYYLKIGTPWIYMNVGHISMELSLVKARELVFGNENRFLIWKFGVSALGRIEPTCEGWMVMKYRRLWQVLEDGQVS